MGKRVPKRLITGYKQHPSSAEYDLERITQDIASHLCAIALAKGSFDALRELSLMAGSHNVTESLHNKEFRKSHSTKPIVGVLARLVACSLPVKWLYTLFIKGTCPNDKDCPLPKDNLHLWDKVGAAAILYYVAAGSYENLKTIYQHYSPRLRSKPGREDDAEKSKPLVSK